MNIYKLFDDAKRGSKRSLGRLLSILESPSNESFRLLKEFVKHGGKSHVIGITGIPGSGKSTLISKMISAMRRKGYSIAIVAIDPTSPYSQGALLGDRLRMQEHSTDPKVFIRSVSTRGVKGGLSLAALSMIEAFDAVGYDKIIVESVGVGQADIDIMNTAHTLLVITMPGVGDEIQALKAGIMEIGDVYVLNKSDKPEAAKTFEYLKFALETGELEIKHGWTPRIVKTSAIMGMGIDQVVSIIDEHYNYIRENSIFMDKLRDRRLFMLKLLVESLFLDNLDDMYRSGEIEELFKANDYYTSSIKIIELLLKKIRKIDNS